MTAGAPRIPDRTAAPVRAAEPTRSDSSDRAGGPPRLALAGNKPTWRERQAQKEAEAAGGGAASTNSQPSEPPPAVPSTDIGTAEAVLPKRTGYVPPARRAAEGAGAPPPSRGRTGVEGSSARDDSVSGPPGAEKPSGRWMPRSQQQARDGSPALGGGDGLGARNLSGLRREGTGGLNRDQSTDSRATGTGGEEEVVRKPAPGKYVPVHLRNK